MDQPKLKLIKFCQCKSVYQNEPISCSFSSIFQKMKLKMGLNSDNDRWVLPKCRT